MPKIPHSSVHGVHGVPAKSHFVIRPGAVRYELMYIIENHSVKKSRQSANKVILRILVVLVPWVGSTSIKYRESTPIGLINQDPQQVRPPSFLIQNYSTHLQPLLTLLARFIILPRDTSRHVRMIGPDRVCTRRATLGNI